jgi:hypothetical protein
MEGSGLAPLRELFRLLTAHRAMVQIGGGPPAPETRTLQRYKSEVGDDDEGQAELKTERAETWRQAMGLRKKFCSLGVIRVSTVSAFQQAFEKSEAYKAQANLKPAEAHRMFLFSADLWQECSATTWATPPSGPLPQSQP